MMSGAWLEANTPARLAMARPRRGVCAGGPHFFQEIRLGHSRDHEIEPEEIRVDPGREERDVVALYRSTHLGLQGIAVEDLLPVGAVFVAERSGALQIEEEFGEPIVSHGRYFAISASLLFCPVIAGQRHEPDWPGAPRRPTPAVLLLHQQEVLHIRCSTPRDHHPPAGLELIDRGLRDRRGPRRNDDGVERRGRGPAAVTVAHAHLDVTVPEFP